MALKDYQSIINLNRVYEVSMQYSGIEQLLPSLEFLGGQVNIYASQAEPSTPPTDMALFRGDASGNVVLNIIPNYLYIEQASGTTTQIVATALMPDEQSAVVPTGGAFSSAFSTSYDRVT